MATYAAELWNRDIDSAEVLGKQMLDYSTANKFKKGIGQAYGTLAAIVSYKGNDGEAIWYYKQANTIFNEIGEIDLMHKCDYNVAIILDESQESKEALPYAIKANNYFSKKQDTSYMVYTYQLLGTIKQKLHHKFQDTDSTFKKGVALAKSIPDTIHISRLSTLLANFYVDEDTLLTEADNLVSNSLLLQEKKKKSDLFVLGYTYYVKGKLLGKKGSLKKALIYNDSAIAVYEKLNLPQGLKVSYENRAELFYNSKAYKDAFIANKAFEKYKDSLSEKSKKTKFERLKVEYEVDNINFEKVKIENNAAKLNIKYLKSRNYFTTALAVLIFIILLVVFYIFRYRNTKQKELLKVELNQLSLEKKNKESELKALKAQMNPHFIFNALNSVQEYIISNNKTAASEYLGRFAHLIRRYLVQSDLEYITIEEEVDSLQTYLSLESIRFEEDFKYSISLSQALENKDYKIPTMLVQPFVENAITHGLLHKEGKRTLVISFTKGQGNTVLCIIEDNGVGRDFARQMKKQKNNPHQSFSMAAIKERLRLFAEKTNDKVAYFVTDLKEGETAVGTKVLLTLPIENSYESNTD